ncbi:MAG: T9SS type A sorting domain-containing protein [Bacteroidetes bacterium]|nr:T9SS type A sorting domain-containing protein [Bacteroidota bacterium]
MRNLYALLFIISALVGFGQVNDLASFQQPYAGIKPILPQVPEGVHFDTTLSFCLNKSFADSMYYQYDSWGRVVAYSGVYSSTSGLIYAEHQITYGLSGLQTWERLPNQTNNGRRYLFAYDSLDRISSVEAYHTSMYGEVFDYSAERTASENDYDEYQWNDKDGVYKLQVDWRINSKVDSTWIMLNGEVEPSEVIRYRHQLINNEWKVFKKTYHVFNAYYGYFTTKTGSEPGGSGYFKNSNNYYTYLPSSNSSWIFVLDSIRRLERAFASEAYHYKKWASYRLLSYSKSSPSYNPQRICSYSSMGLLASDDNRASEKWFWDWRHLGLAASDTGTFVSYYFWTQRPPMKVYPCQQALAIADTETLNFSLYPNPSQGALNLRFPEPSGQIEIRNGAGQVRQQWPVNSMEMAIDLQSLASGIYYLCYRHQGQYQSIKWLKL